jgi:hypothetical protein
VRIVERLLRRVAALRAAAGGQIQPVAGHVVPAPGSRDGEPARAWLLYSRGVSLLHQGKVDAGVSALSRAEAAFVTPHGRSLAAYRQALAFEQAGRCDEADHAFRRYEQKIRTTEPASAALAQRIARDCRPRGQPVP